MKSTIVVFSCSCHKGQIYLMDIDEKLSTINKYVGGSEASTANVMHKGERFGVNSSIFKELKDLSVLLRALT